MCLAQEPQRSDASEARTRGPRSRVVKHSTTEPLRSLIRLCHLTEMKHTNIIQLMHSFEVNIRICQPENSDVHRGEAEVNITFEG